MRRTLLALTAVFGFHVATLSLPVFAQDDGLEEDYEEMDYEGETDEAPVKDVAAPSKKATPTETKTAANANKKEKAKETCKLETKNNKSNCLCNGKSAPANKCQG